MSIGLGCRQLTDLLLAACEDPNVLEIADCCNIGLKIAAEPEAGPVTTCEPSVQPKQSWLKSTQALLCCLREQDKAYPRQWWVQGRVRVQLKKPDGSLANPDIPNRESALAPRKLRQDCQCSQSALTGSFTCVPL